MTLAKEPPVIESMNHFTILAEDPGKTRDYYCGLLGLQVGPRPDLGFPGDWLNAGGGPAVLHIVYGRPLPSTRAGVIDHMAFSARDLKAVKARFDERGIRYDLAAPFTPAEMARIRGATAKNGQEWIDYPMIKGRTRGQMQLHLWTPAGATPATGAATP